MILDLSKTIVTKGKSAKYETKAIGSGKVTRDNGVEKATFEGYTEEMALADARSLISLKGPTGFGLIVNHGMDLLGRTGEKVNGLSLTKRAEVVGTIFKAGDPADQVRYLAAAGQGRKAENDFIKAYMAKHNL